MVTNEVIIGEIDQITAMINFNKAEGEINLAIIETLYNCGLRVSELTGLKISDLYFEEGFIVITGKGNKQRLVPIAEHTEKLITNYLERSRIHINCKPEYLDTLFLNHRGNNLTRAMIFTSVKQLVKLAGIEKTLARIRSVIPLLHIY